MIDAISRSAVLELLCDGCNSRNNTAVPRCGDMCRDFKEVVALPALDVVPVVHARWNEEDGTCSACYHEACYDEWTEPKWDYDWDENLVQTGEETHIQFIFSPYCPHCGARMDDGEDVD